MYCQDCKDHQYTSKDRNTAEQWALTFAVYSTNDFEFNQVLDRDTLYIEAREAFLYSHESCSYLCDIKSTIKKHIHPPNKAVYCRNHIAHQVFGQKDPKFTLIRENIRPAAPLGCTVKEALKLFGQSQATVSAPYNSPSDNVSVSTLGRVQLQQAIPPPSHTFPTPVSEQLATAFPSALKPNFAPRLLSP